MMPISLDYAEEIFGVFDDKVTKYMFPSTPKEVEDTRIFIRSTMDKLSKGEELVVVILDKDTMEFLGNTGLHRINTSTPELGIWIKTAAHGHGYGREAVTAMKEWADRNVKYEHLVYPVAEENIPSRKIPESLGGILVSNEPKSNQAGVIYQAVTYHIYPPK
ncbi:GNAT family N-acetyltransferase [Candidatus Gracilibacteria bacterium]|nr:GNAT family N-acetyltransferase [Candidatus Gracilibacteria bacterium]